MAHLRLGSHVTVVAKVVDKFGYPSTSINTNHNVNLANRCYFALIRQLKGQVFSRRTIAKLYKSLIIPVLLHSAEAWTMLTSNESAPRVFDRKVSWTIRGPLDTANIANDGAYDIYSDSEIAARLCLLNEWKHSSFDIIRCSTCRPPLHWKKRLMAQYYWFSDATAMKKTKR